MPSPQSLSLVILLALGINLVLPATLFGQECRKQCSAREILDPNGCCAPLELETPLDTLPDTSKMKTEIDWSSNIQAHHFSSHTTPLQEQPLTLPSPTRDPKQLRQRATDAWQDLLSLDEAILTRSEICQKLQSSPADLRQCIRSFRGLREQRQSHLERAVPLWTTLMRSMPKGAIERPKIIYYLGVGLSLLGFHQEAVEQLRVIIKLHPTSPYTPFALATLGDFFFAQNAPEVAAPLYLRASQDSTTALQSYAIYMQGWCLALEKQPDQALQAMVQALKLTSQSRVFKPAIYNKRHLRQTLLRDITNIYAQIGNLDKAQNFYAYLGLTKVEQQLWLDTLKAQTPKAPAPSPVQKQKERRQRKRRKLFTSPGQGRLPQVPYNP